jgi:hypothetical protein
VLDGRQVIRELTYCFYAGETAKVRSQFMSHMQFVQLLALGKYFKCSSTISRAAMCQLGVGDIDLTRNVPCAYDLGSLIFCHHCAGRCALSSSLTYRNISPVAGSALMVAYLLFARGQDCLLVGSSVSKRRDAKGEKGEPAIAGYVILIAAEYLNSMSV